MVITYNESGIAKSATNESIAGTDATIEGRNNLEKTYPSDFHETIKNGESFITYHWEHFSQKELQLSNQLQGLTDAIEGRGKTK